MRRLRRPRWISIAATSAVLVALLAPHARAQSAEAQALFNDAAKLMKQGKLAEACDAFEASNRIEARAGTLIRLGECREANHELASAWSAYKDALTRVKDPRKQKIATAKVAELEPRLSYLTITVTERADGLELARNGKPVDPGLWNRAVPVNGGDYVITASAPDRSAWTQTVSVPVEHGKIAVDVPALAANPKPKPTPAIAPPQQPPPPERHPGTFTGKRKLAVGLVAVGAGAAVAGALIWNSAKAKRDDAFALCPDPTASCAEADRANALIDTAHSRALQADAAFAAAGVAAIVATTLWLTGSPREHRVTAQVTPQGGGIALQGRF